MLSHSKKVFYQLNAFLKGQNLFDDEQLIFDESQNEYPMDIQRREPERMGGAIDGFKVAAQNSKKNNYNAKKVEQHLDYINKQINEFLETFDQAVKGDLGFCKQIVMAHFKAI